MCKLFKEMKISGFFYVLTRELEMFNREYFFRFLRIYPDRYQLMFLIVGPELQRH